MKKRESSNFSLSKEKELIKWLLSNYEKTGKLGRPVVNTSETVKVSYGLALIQILDLDEKNQVLTTNVWSRYTWTDAFLKWDPTKFENVEQVRIPIDEIWTPDIVLYNYADTRLKEHRDALAVIQYTGSVLWIPRSIFKSTCPIDITHFPFDIQNCSLKFGSWTYDGWKLDLDFYDNKDSIDTNDYVESNEWKLLGFPARKHTKKYPCCEEPYPDLTFYIRVKRKSAFYNYILILPCVLLSSLTLVIFWLPPESPAKMILAIEYILGMNIFVAFFFLLLLLANNTPPASKSIPKIGMNIFVAFFLLLLLLADSTPPAAKSVPLIGAYFCLNMVLITLSTFLSVIVINLYFRGDKKSRVPKWLKKFIVDYVGRLLCMKNELAQNDDSPKTTDYVINVETGKKSERKRIRCPELKYNKFQPPPMEANDIEPLKGNSTPRINPQISSQASSIESDVREIKRILKSYMNKVNDKEAQIKAVKEWKLVALVLDRVFFFTYLATIVISLGTIFPRG
ncbi:DgyrCDS7085 [Dimorphilus gyrociliatus]|uniref:DgyrCDS7085 n=1 Tax=Dimorphilus gyrociliatus TaxID=2664684 RepID=A0A7I8VQ05_9ANNE|nr:DgyrCDS7085 [Dimorphilus gyrociliatus]